MTTIIFQKTSDSLSIAYDSQITGGNEIINTSLDKVFFKGKLLFGVAGNLSFLNLIKFLEIKEPEDGELEKWAVTYLVNKLRKEAKEMSDDDSKIKFQILIANQTGEIVEIDDDYSIVTRADNSYTIGSGGHFARGAIKVGATVTQALEVAAQSDIYTGGKLHYKTFSLAPAVRLKNSTKSGASWRRSTAAN